MDPVAAYPAKLGSVVGFPGAYSTGPAKCGGSLRMGRWRWTEGRSGMVLTQFAEHFAVLNACQVPPLWDPRSRSSGY